MTHSRVAFPESSSTVLKKVFEWTGMDNSEQNER